MEELSDAQKQVIAEQEQVNVLLGDMNPKEVDCSNNKTYYITRSKCRVSVLASSHFKNTQTVTAYTDRLKEIRDHVAALKDNKKAIAKKMEEFEKLQHDMISEYVSKIENTEEVCKGLAYILLNDEEAIYADQYVVRSPFLKFFGFKDRKREEKDRLWYELFSELDNEDIHHLFIAWTQKLSSEVFFYTMGLVHNLNKLKAQNPQNV